MRMIYLSAVTTLCIFASLPVTSHAQAPVNPAAEAPQAAASRPVSVPQLRQIASKSYADKDYATFLKAVSALHELRPWNSDYMSYVVLANALTGNKSGAYEMMLMMQQQGLAADFNTTEDSASIRDTEAYAHINDLMIRAAEPVGAAELQITLPEAVVTASDLTWDPTREAFLVSDPRHGSIHSVTRDGKSGKLLSADDDNGLWAIYGLVVDAKNNRLWVSSAANAEFAEFEKQDAGNTGLFEFSLDELELLAKYPVPDDGRRHALGAMVQTDAGDIYAVDTVMPMVFRLAAGEDQIKPFAMSNDNVYLRDITISDDSTRLYLADYELGITVLDLVGKQAAKVSGPSNLNFGGIEALEYWNGHLVMTQSGIDPQRVLRLTLSADGASVESVAPLAIAQPFFDHPAAGALLDGSLWFIANSYGVRNAVQPQPIGIAVTSVENVPDLVSPDIDKFWDEYYEKTGQPRPDQTKEDS